MHDNMRHGKLKIDGIFIIIIRIFYKRTPNFNFIGCVMDDVMRQFLRLMEQGNGTPMVIIIGSW